MNNTNNINIKDLTDDQLISGIDNIRKEQERRGLIKFYRNRRLWMLVMFLLMEILAVTRVGPTTFHDYILSGILGLCGGYFVHDMTDRSIFVRK